MIVKFWLQTNRQMRTEYDETAMAPFFMQRLIVMGWAASFDANSISHVVTMPNRSGKMKDETLPLDTMEYTHKIPPDPFTPEPDISSAQRQLHWPTSQYQTPIDLVVWTNMEIRLKNKDCSEKCEGTYIKANHTTLLFEWPK